MVRVPVRFALCSAYIIACLVFDAPGTLLDPPSSLYFPPSVHVSVCFVCHVAMFVKPSAVMTPAATCLSVLHSYFFRHRTLAVIFCLHVFTCMPLCFCPTHHWYRLLSPLHTLLVLPVCRLARPHNTEAIRTLRVAGFLRVVTFSAHIPLFFFPVRPSRPSFPPLYNLHAWTTSSRPLSKCIHPLHDIS